MIKRFESILLEEAFDFVQKQQMKVRAKILQNIRRSETLTDPKLFKKLDGEIWEFRTKYTGNEYRLFAFWDKEDKQETLVLASHGRIKKTNKVDKSDIEKAERIRQAYFKNKTK
ncbi:MAG: type II toxin-antitoxin system RelE/ParE family toxin [Bacteroidetes bacterium]|nr:type II toxin-antitoxin system RelE/ParE family toxin [Bacteroidota bacterium]